MTFANLSGGRDSTAMVVKWLELGKELDYILFCDTEVEYPQMYDYINKLDSYLKREFNKEIVVLQSKKCFWEMAFQTPITKGERQGRFKGIPRKLGMDYCTRDLKINPSKEFVLSVSANKFRNVVLIGYTFDEVQRGRTSNLTYASAKYPLHEWHWNEEECESFLRQRGIANPLYRDFSRTGCFLCPKQSLKSLYTLYSKYPKEWLVMKRWEEEAKRLDCVNQTFMIKESLEELEAKFKEKDKRPSLDFGDEYALSETCFCKG